jgi:hypothetical protein
MSDYPSEAGIETKNSIEENSLEKIKKSQPCSKLLTLMGNSGLNMFKIMRIRQR